MILIEAIALVILPPFFIAFFVKNAHLKDIFLGPNYALELYIESKLKKSKYTTVLG